MERFVKKEYFLYISAFLMDGSFAIVSICIPLHALQFGATYEDLGFISASGALVYSVSCLFSGRLADRIGYRRIMTVACFLIALAFIGYLSIDRIWHFALLSVLSAVAISYYWPPLQAWLGRGKPRHVLLPTLGRFNVAWALGVFIGPALGGTLFEIHPLSGFVLGGVLVGLLFVGMTLLPVHESDSVAESGVVQSSATQFGHFLPLALLANFATFFAIGVVRSLFPKLATDLGITPGLLGYLLAMIAMGQLAAFYFMARTDRWQFRVAPIVFAQLFGAVGLVLLSVGTHPVVFACGFLLIGALIGVTFTASIFYSLFAEGPGGRRTGIHEAIVGSGFLLGPLAGGLAAEHLNPRAPYVLAGVVIVVTIGIQIVIHKSKSSRSFVPQAGD
jgi:MFS family permease